MSDCSRAWSWRHAFAASDLPAMTKAVLHTLGMFMNELGEGCYPSVADIARLSGLDKKTVLKHLAVARDAGWVAVAQHGYRGQKWKRNEYAARWPERDLVAPCAPADEGADAGEATDDSMHDSMHDSGQGGGAAPPPSGVEKVVEPGGEGGGTGGSKVVEEVHQDKTSPETTPVTSPEERERGRADEAHNHPAEAPKRIEAEGWALLKNWPGFDGMPKEPALAIWRGLDAGERGAARRRFLPWLELLRAQKKAHVPAPSTYLRERLWEAVADPSEAPPPPAIAPPFGKLWGARRLAWLLAGPGPLPKPSAFIAGLIAAGGAEGDRERLRHQATHGWPLVRRMDDLAGQGRGWAIPADGALETLAEGLVPVRVGSPEWLDWQGEHERRGWPWLPEPGRQEWAYFPAGGPLGLAAFAAAAGGIGGRDAA